MKVSLESIEESFKTFLVSENLELYDLNIASNPFPSKIEVYVYSSNGIDYKIIERLSYHFQGILQDLNIEKGTYELVVSSPGLERKIKSIRHFELAIGEYIKIKTINNIYDDYVFTGQLLGVRNDLIKMLTSSGTEINIGFDKIKNAKVVLKKNKKEMIG